MPRKKAAKSTVKKKATRRRIKAPEKQRPEYLPGYIWKQEKVDRVCTFIETFCRFTKGDNAGQSITLLPWQRDEVIAPLFGWYNKDGTRRFRNSSIWISKKNGKSFLVSALSAYMLLLEFSIVSS